MSRIFNGCVSPVQREAQATNHEVAEAAGRLRIEHGTPTSFEFGRGYVASGPDGRVPTDEQSEDCRLPEQARRGA